MNEKKNIVSRPKVLEGTVVSDKMKDTIVVLIEDFHKHPMVGKFIKTRKRYKVHDAGNTKKIGEKVSIVECAPISKHKHFTVK